MYLSRLILNPRSRAVRQDLADCQALHRTVMAGFLETQTEGDARAPLGVLHRLEVHPRTGAVTLLVQSEARPDWSGLESRWPDYLLDTGGKPPNPDFKAVDEYYGRIRPGMVLAFRLRANPTRKIDTKSGPDGERRNGQRVELRGEEAQIEWLRRKAVEGGFELLSVRAAPDVPNARALPEQKVVGARGAGAAGRLTLASVLFEGDLRVADAGRFRETMEKGIGSAKAYGFGLLSVAPR